MSDIKNLLEAVRAYAVTLPVNNDARNILAIATIAENFEQENQRLQAKIDSLMLEHCPEDMTKEQVDRWAKKQAKAIPYTVGWKRIRNKD
jgi:nicotinate-nucleotide pyrophosphorylase